MTDQEWAELAARIKKEDEQLDPAQHVHQGFFMDLLAPFFCYQCEICGRNYFRLKKVKECCAEERARRAQIASGGYVDGPGSGQVPTGGPYGPFGAYGGSYGGHGGPGIGGYGGSYGSSGWR